MAAQITGSFASAKMFDFFPRFIPMSNTKGKQRPWNERQRMVSSKLNVTKIITFDTFFLHDHSYWNSVFSLSFSERGKACFGVRHTIKLSMIISTVVKPWSGKLLSVHPFIRSFRFLCWSDSIEDVCLIHSIIGRFFGWRIYTLFNLIPLNDRRFSRRQKENMSSRPPGMTMSETFLVICTK